MNPDLQVQGAHSPHSSMASTQTSMPPPAPQVSTAGGVQVSSQPSMQGLNTQTMSVAASQVQTHTPCSMPQTISPISMPPHSTTAMLPQSAIQSMAQSQLPVQVIQQQIPSQAYLQQLYPQQQMLLPGNLTIQHAGMGPTLQSLGPGASLSLQLQNKPVDHKGQGTGATIIPSSITGMTAGAKSVTFSAPNLMSTTGQMIAAAGGKPCMPGQMITAKGAAQMLQSQTSYVPSTTASQTVVIGQLGMISSQPSILPAQSKPMDNQKGKPFVMSQQTPLQPKSPNMSNNANTGVGASGVTNTQVINSNQFKQLQSNQLIANQAPTTAMISQAQLLGSLQALNASFQQGITWANPGGLQSPALLTAQNPPIFIRSQHSDMFIQSPPQTSTLHAVPMATAPAPIPTPTPTQMQAATATAATAGIQQLQKPKQVRPASSVATQTVTSTAVTVHSQAIAARAPAKSKTRGQTNRASPGPGGVNHQHAFIQTQTANTQTQTQTFPPPQQQQQKADAANQTSTQTTGIQIQQHHHHHHHQHPPKSTPEMRSTATQSTKSTATTTAELKQPPVVVPVQPPSSSFQQKQELVHTAATAHVAIAPAAPQQKTVTTCTHVHAIPSPPVAAPPPTTMKQHVDEKMEVSVMVPEQSSCDKRTNSEMVTGKQESVNKNGIVSSPVTLVSVPEPMKDKQPQKAIVKPNVLTHVIEGYIIQEGPEPFPVSRSSLLSETASPKPMEQNGKATEAEIQHAAVAQGKVGKKKKVGYKSRKGWRKQVGRPPLYKNQEWQQNQQNQQLGMPVHNHVNSTAAITPQNAQTLKNNVEMEVESVAPVATNFVETSETNGPESTVSHETAASNHKEEMEVDVPERVPEAVANKSPRTWTVQEVVEFIHGLPGCSDYADEFRSQEIDGQALLLLKEDHLMTAMSMKLGPALKICAKINSLKDELQRQ